jgi:transposase
MRVTTSNEMRQRIVDAYVANNNTTTISGILGVNKSTVHSVIKVYCKENRVDSKKRGGARSKLTEEAKATIRSWVDEDCSITLRRLKERSSAELQIDVTEKTIDRCLSAFQYTLKRVHVQPERRNTEEAIQVRANYANSFMDLLSRVDDHHLIFIDEVGFSVSMRSRRGRSPIGTRAVQVVPALRTRNISIFCAMQKTGLLFYQAKATAYNTSSCVDALKEMFEKLLALEIHNAVLILDNVPFHHARLVREATIEHGHQLMFISAYSPFLNPIENMFSKWKEYVRNMRPQNEAHLLELISAGGETISSADCDGYFRHMLGAFHRCINRQPIIED